MEDKILFKDLSYQIVGAAIKVWKTLGYGFLEKMYENALVIELKNQEIPFEKQKPLKVIYECQVIGDYVTDIIVDRKIILELKAAKGIDDYHFSQTLNYLKATGLRLGIILNFGPMKMEYKRLVL